VKGIIKVGASIFQDHHYGKWPSCLPPGSPCRYEADDPYMVFDIEWRDTGPGYWECKADGFGHMKSKGDSGSYGNGSIFVSGRVNVVVVEQ